MNNIIDTKYTYSSKSQALLDSYLKHDSIENLKILMTGCDDTDKFKIGECLLLLIKSYDYIDLKKLSFIYFYLNRLLECSFYLEKYLKLHKNDFEMLCIYM